MGKQERMLHMLQLGLGIVSAAMIIKVMSMQHVYFKKKLEDQKNGKPAQVMDKENLAIGLALAAVVISMYGTYAVIKALREHHHEIEQKL